MISREYHNKLLLVTQPHHAELAAQLAAHWGNDRFSKPEPLEPMILAAGEHDNGWREWDNRPTIDPEKGVPYTFATLSYVDHAKLYWRGILRAVEEDPYEGLMVCMHGVGLYKQRYGTDPSMTRQPRDKEEKLSVAKLISDGELLQKKLRKKLAATSHYRGMIDDARIWANYKLLQVFDRIALHLCWKGVVPYTVSPVPVSYNPSKEVTIMLTPKDDEHIELSPYPFHDNPVNASVRASVLPLRKYRTDLEFRQAYYIAETLDLSFKFSAGEG